MQSVVTGPIVTDDVGSSLARWSLAPVLLWMGAMQFTEDGGRALGLVLTDNRLFFWVGEIVSPFFLAAFVGLAQIGAALLLVTGRRPGRRLGLGALISAVLAVFPLTLFLTNPVWIESLGGFPFIGSGQGLLKYVTILGVSLYLFAEAAPFDDPRRRRFKGPGLHLMLVGLLLVLGWIGLMKFTAVEAAGIERLLRTSPFLSWMLGVFSLQGASNFIGVAELVAVFLLSSWWWRPSVFVWGAAMGVAIFATTLTFLFTLPGWHPTLGFPALSGSGLFLLKDLVLLAAVLILLIERRVPDTPDG